MNNGAAFGRPIVPHPGKNILQKKVRFVKTYSGKSCTKRTFLCFNFLAGMLRYFHSASFW